MSGGKFSIFLKFCGEKKKEKQIARVMPNGEISLYCYGEKFAITHLVTHF